MASIKTHDLLAGSFARQPPKPYKTEIPTYDDEDEWEYEYSPTETDTYYLTLDISIPEFTTRDSRNVVQAGRGGYLSSWIGDPEKPGQKPIRRYRFAADDMDDDDDDDNELPEREDQDPEDALASASTTKRAPPNKDGTTPKMVTAASKTTETTAAESSKATAPSDRQGIPDFSHGDTAEVQILELHSTTPIIAYRGRIFEGAWAENTGTELIFASHDASPATSSALPCITVLPGNVALLAASSARLLATERKIQPRMDANLAAVKAEHGIRVVPGRDLNGERRKQASFLENLMAVKRIRGETDAVPVFSRPPQNKTFKDDKDPDWKPRRRKTRFIEAPPRAGRTATITDAVNAVTAVASARANAAFTTSAELKGSSSSASQEQHQQPGAQSETMSDTRFQHPWQPPVTSGSMPFFNTPQFRPRRKKQRIPEMVNDEPWRPVNKTDLPVSRSARTALLSEDHGVSVSTTGKSVDIVDKGKGKEVKNEDLGGVHNGRKSPHHLPRPRHHGRRPAANIAVTLEATSSTLATKPVFRATTDSDGRIKLWDSAVEETLAAVSTGGQASRWTLRFDTGAYFGAGKTFFPEVVVVFEVQAGQHYHVPLLLSPYSYSTYRGS